METARLPEAASRVIARVKLRMRTCFVICTLCVSSKGQVSRVNRLKRFTSSRTESQCAELFQRHLAFDVGRGSDRCVNQHRAGARQQDT